MIIGLCGPKGVGKTTVARKLAEHFQCKVISLADPLKSMVAILGFPNDVLWGDSDKRDSHHSELRFTARRALQKIGCIVRELDQDTWIKLLLQRYDALKKTGCHHVIVDDVRFVNEALGIQSAGGKILSLQRSGVCHSREHESEWPIPEQFVDATLNLADSSGGEDVCPDIISMTQQWIDESKSGQGA